MNTNDSTSALDDGGEARPRHAVTPVKPQDVVLLLKVVAHDGSILRYQRLAEDLRTSVSMAHASVQRLARAGLLREDTRRVNRAALLEFVVHAVKYLCPPDWGEVTRGMPTGKWASPLRQHFVALASQVPTVWPDPEGTARGERLEPIHRTVPRAARSDASLYEWLVLADGVRAGDARERELAVAELQQRLS